MNGLGLKEEEVNSRDPGESLPGRRNVPDRRGWESGALYRRYQRYVKHV